MNPTNKSENMLILAFVSALLFAVLIWFAQNFKDSFGLSAMALGSMVALLWALVVFATLMNYVGLSDKAQALGLPEGSVRAIIALALVGLFGVLASTTMEGGRSFDLAPSQLKQYTDNNPGPKTIIPITDSAGKLEHYKIILPRVPADDFMKQMLTLVGTLMTAVTAFYFGGRTANPSDSTAGPPKLATVKNLNDKPDPVLSLRLTGSNLNNIQTVRLSNGAKEVNANDILSNVGEITCRVSFATIADQVSSWTVSVVDTAGRISEMKDGLVITAPPAVTPEAPAKPSAKLVEPQSVPVDTTAKCVVAVTGVTKLTAASATLDDDAAVQPITTVSITKTDTGAAFDLVPSKKGMWTIKLTPEVGEVIEVVGKLKVE